MDSDRGAGPHRHARTDRRSVRSVDPAPETLYLTAIAVRQARIDALEAGVEREQRRRQQVVDRYERLLDARETGEQRPQTSTHPRGDAAPRDEGARRDEDARRTDGGRVDGTDGRSTDDRPTDATGDRPADPTDPSRLGRLVERVRRLV